MIIAAAIDSADLTISALVGLVVAIVAFFGAKHPAPAGLGLGTYPALFLGGGAFGSAFLICLQVFDRV